MDEVSIRKGIEAYLNDPSITPEKSHQDWMKHKYDTGWKYGKIKDPDKKEHPCLVPYDQLPENQKVKDKFFLAIVKLASG